MRPVDLTPPAVAAVFDVEGKITAFNRTSRTLTANGLTFTVPSVLLAETRDLDLTGNITFDTLTDPTLEAQRSIIGGTVIATGTVSFTAVGTGFCTSFTAAQVFVELAENGLVGLLSNIDPVNGSFRVNGALVRMNTDPRFPSDLLDIGGGSSTADTSHRTDTEPGLRPIAARRRDHAGGHVEIAQRSGRGAPCESVERPAVQERGSGVLRSLHAQQER